MNFDRIPEKLLRWACVAGGLAFALVAVRSAANSNYGTVALMFTAFAVLAAILVFRERIALLIPVLWPLTGTVPVLPIPFAVRDFVCIVVFAAVLMLKAFKMSGRKPVFGWLDGMMLLMVVYVSIGFLRNPVGFEALGSDRVGGRPYFNVFIAFLAYWVLSRSDLGVGSAQKMPAIVTFFRMFEGIIGQLLSWFPVLIGLVIGYYTSPFFISIVSPEAVLVAPGFESTERIGYLLVIGQPLLFFLFAVAPPLALLDPRKIWRPALLILGVVCILLSGFRSALLMVTGVAIISAYAHSGRSEVFRVVGLIFGLIFFLILANGTLFELPRSAQRALSFLPGNWDQVAIDEAKGSTEWRVTMWREMLTTNRYIDSHLLGDGFGFKKRDLELMRVRQQLGINPEQEDFLVSGGVHSGPVSSVRFVGYLGLAIYLVILSSMAWEAWKLIKRAKGTQFQTLTFLFAFPAVIEPVYFVFVFGAFEKKK